MLADILQFSFVSIFTWDGVFGCLALDSRLVTCPSMPPAAYCLLPVCHCWLCCLPLRPTEGTVKNKLWLCCCLFLFLCWQSRKCELPSWVSCSIASSRLLCNLWAAVASCKRVNCSIISPISWQTDHKLLEFQLKAILCSCCLHFINSYKHTYIVYSDGSHHLTYSLEV